MVIALVLPEGALSVKEMVAFQRGVPFKVFKYCCKVVGRPVWSTYRAQHRMHMVGHDAVITNATLGVETPMFFGVWLFSFHFTT